MKSSLLMFNYRTYLGFLRAKKDRNIIAFFFCKYCHTVAELSNATRKWSFLLLGLDVVSIRCVVLCHAINGVFLIFPISWVRLADILMRPNLIGSNPSSPLFFFFFGIGKFGYRSQLMGLAWMWNPSDGRARFGFGSSWGPITFLRIS